MYKKFILHVLIIVLGIYSIFVYIIFNHKMLYMNQEYPMWLNIKNIINSKSDAKYDLIMIGDSRAKAGYIPNNNLTLKSQSLAIGGGTPIEGYYILKKYLQNNPIPKKIIFSFAPSHLDSVDVYWERTVKFDFLNQGEYIEIEKNAMLIEDKNTLGLNKSYIDYKIPLMYGNDFKNGIIERRWNVNKIVYKDCTNSKGHYFFGRENFANGFNAESSKASFNQSKLIAFYFIKLIKLAKVHHIQIYYYTMPFNRSSFEKTPKHYKDGYNRYISKIATDYNISICNKLSFLTNDNFGDPSHLFHGANISTREIVNCVLNK